MSEPFVKSRKFSENVLDCTNSRDQYHKMGIQSRNSQGFPYPFIASGRLQRSSSALLIFSIIVFGIQAIPSVHQANRCSCVCSVNYAKVFEVCLNRYTECDVVSCKPFALGFACCKPGAKPFADLATRRRTQNELQDISNRARDAAIYAREKSKKASEILQRCEQRVAKIGRQKVLNRMTSRRTINFSEWLRRSRATYVGNRRYSIVFVKTALNNHLYN